MAEVYLESAKIIGAALATCCLVGSAIGIGSVFGGFLIAYSRNSYLKDSLFQYCILGFALSEAVGLLGLMVGFFLLFK